MNQTPAHKFKKGEKILCYEEPFLYRDEEPFLYHATAQTYLIGKRSSWSFNFTFFTSGLKINVHWVKFQATSHYHSQKVLILNIFNN